jgi:hypothetical protein
VLTSKEKATGMQPVPLDLRHADHGRLQTRAERDSRSKSSYVRMAVFKQVAADESPALGAVKANVSRHRKV